MSQQVLIAHKTGTNSHILRNIVINAGCQPKSVETFSAAIDALQESKASILLLDEQFDHGQVLELIPVFKHLHKGIKIILLADTTSVSFLRKARAVGIFYHALQPQSSEDCHELQLALECAQEALQKKEPNFWKNLVPTFGIN